MTLPIASSKDKNSRYVLRFVKTFLIFFINHLRFYADIFDISASYEKILAAQFYNGIFKKGT